MLSNQWKRVCINDKGLFSILQGLPDLLEDYITATITSETATSINLQFYLNSDLSARSYNLTINRDIYASSYYFPEISVTKQGEGSSLLVADSDHFAYPSPVRTWDVYVCADTDFFTFAIVDPSSTHTSKAFTVLNTNDDGSLVLTPSVPQITAPDQSANSTADRDCFLTTYADFDAPYNHDSALDVDDQRSLLPITVTHTRGLANDKFFFVPTDIALISVNDGVSNHTFVKDTKTYIRIPMLNDASAPLDYDVNNLWLRIL